MNNSAAFSLDHMVANQIGMLHGLVMEALIPWGQADKKNRQKLALDGVSHLQNMGAVTPSEGDILRAHFHYFHENSAADKNSAVEKVRSLGAESGADERGPMMIALLGIANDSVARFGPGEAAADLAGGIFGGVVGGLLGAGLGGAALSYAASTIDPV